METKFEINENNQSIIHKEPLNFKINDILLKDIINSIKNKKQVENLIISKGKNKMIMDKFGKLLCIIFKNPIKVKYIHGLYNSKYMDFIEKNVKSTLQIDESLEKLNIKVATFTQKISGITYQRDYFKNKNLLNNNTGEGIVIKNSEIHYILESNNISLGDTKIFDKNLLSLYFDKYCDYPSKKQKMFYFYDSISRQNLFNNFITLLNNNDIKIFKFTGPSGGGKSVSLLYLSRMFKNIIYLNIKLINKLFQQAKVDEYLKMILYEFNRLDFQEKKEEHKKSFEDIFKNNSTKSPWELLEKLSSFFSNQNTKITLIFDQYKSKYITKNEFEKITSYLNSTFKLIICSSINNKEIGKEVADTLIKNRKNLVILAVENQYDIFYYMNLCPRKKFKLLFKDRNNKNRNKEYKLFNYEPKYIKLLSNKTKFKDIERHILKKMKEHYTNLGLDEESYFFNIYTGIGKNINYDILPLNTIPFKYLNLNLDNNTFTFKYKFPFIRNIIEKKIKCIDTEDYFKKKKYNDNELYANLKGHYFEFASINNICKLNNFFGCKIQYQLTVKSIVKMEECSENKIEINIEDINNHKKILKINKDDLYMKKQNQLKNDLFIIGKNYNDSVKNINYYLYNYLTNENKKIEMYFLEKKRKRKNKERSISKINYKNIIKITEINKGNDLNYYRKEKKEKKKNEESNEEDENEKENGNNEKKERKIEINDKLTLEGENDFQEEDEKETEAQNEKEAKDEDDEEEEGEEREEGEEKSDEEKESNEEDESSEEEEESESENEDKKMKKKENVKYIIYDDNFKDGCILVKQRNLNGETLDLGVLLGEKYDKTFIGFQMKFYGENSSLKSEITKDFIRNKYKNILYKCYENYGIKITNWHYIMCLYYNPDDESHYNKNLVNKCNDNDIQYIFYNPNENKFYDRNKNDLENIKLDLKSNIDFISIANPYNFLIDTGFLEEYYSQTSNKSKISIKGKIFNYSLNTVKELIKKNLGLNVEEVCKLEIVKNNNFPIPQNYYLLVFQSDNNIIAYYNIKNKLKCININNNIELEPSYIPCYLNIGKRKNKYNVDFYIFRIII